MEKESIIYLSVAILLFLLGGLVFLRVQRLLKRWFLARRFKRGAVGETIAKKWLEQQGFKILSEQEEFEARVGVDGVNRIIKMKPDYIVKKAGRVAVVEVKTGKHAPDPLYSNTRRQILEYWYHLDIDDAYLFDAESKVLLSLDFSTHKTIQRANVTGISFISFMVGAVCSGLVIWNIFANK